ncbi:probable protein phosphatase 2C 25 [Tanacetum coccineum]
MDIDKPSMELYLHGGYVDCGNDVWRMQGSLGVSRAIGDKHLGRRDTLPSDIHNGCSTQPRHTASIITSNVHCHRKDATRCQQQTVDSIEHVYTAFTHLIRQSRRQEVAVSSSTFEPLASHSSTRLLPDITNQISAKHHPLIDCEGIS